MYNFFTKWRVLFLLWEMFSLKAEFITSAQRHFSHSLQLLYPLLAQLGSSSSLCNFTFRLLHVSSEPVKYCSSPLTSLWSDSAANNHVSAWHKTKWGRGIDREKTEEGLRMTNKKFSAYIPGRSAIHLNEDHAWELAPLCIACLSCRQTQNHGLRGREVLISVPW